MKLTWENRSTRGKTCPSATLSTTNPIWTDLGSKPVLRGDRPATNCLSRGTASAFVFPSAVVLWLQKRNVGKRQMSLFTAPVRGAPVAIIAISTTHHLIQDLAPFSNRSSARHLSAVSRNFSV
jgi:hypothetical protein